MTEPTNTCPRCGAAFTCGMRAGAPACWCADFPAAFAVPGTAEVAADAGCYCPRCLAALIAQKAASRAQTDPPGESG